MPSNPFVDAWAFLIGNTKDYNNLGVWKYGFVLLFFALIVASVVIAVRNWRENPAQRTGTHLATWVIRVLIGSMWFQGMLWKLPLFSTSNGLYYWMEQMAGRAAFAIHRDLVTNVLLPLFHFVNPLVFLTELALAMCLILGFGVRIASVVAMLFTLNLWLGIYLDRGAEDPDEWPWSYFFLVMVHAFFAIHAAGRSLGLDALLRRRSAGQVAHSGFGRLYGAVS
ncbi:MAG: hypothetical protein AVDCRST_MAG90-931 [uncultured Microvirga sp.]|uniref:TQO small subunit DoxD domain-containing protein n=1 Tax=uncultured Microvirga sp. TaxID=412392 RepID=A0A6J4L0I2_9HYPH|nr:MAG: hypothetical protein AVDCRST_MAG90-931 [uncultured Microvirga sp.]